MPSVEGAAVMECVAALRLKDQYRVVPASVSDYVRLND